MDLVVMAAAGIDVFFKVDVQMVVAEDSVFSDA